MGKQILERNIKPAIVVTGNAGHIGSNLVNWLIENKSEYEIIGIDDLSGGYLDWINSKCTFYYRNVSSDLTDIFENHNIKIIFHAAAIASEAMSNFNRKFYYTSNVVNSANLINYAIKYPVDRFVFFSSMAVYGNNQVPFTEDQIPSPIDCYGIGKFAVEMDLKSAKEQHGLKYTIVRPHSVYGPNQNLWDAYRNVIGIFIRKILYKEPLSIYGDGEQRRAFTYIDDIMMPLWKCANDDSTLWETFNIGNDEEISINELAEIIEEEIGYCGRKYYPAVHEVQNAYSDHSKVTSRIGLECKTTIREGFRKMWNWAKNEPYRKLQTFDKFELEVGLPEQFKKSTSGLNINIHNQKFSTT